MHQTCPAAVAAPADADPLDERLPLSGLLALAMTGFIAILSETLPAGLLGQIADGMQISQAMAGQWVTAYALGSLLTAIPLVTLTQGWWRRRTLLLAIGGFILFNALTALSPSNGLTLVARFLTGAAAGLAWGLIAGHARRMVPAARQGKAMAVAMVGAPIALSLGVPAGTWLGEWLGWRATFVGVTLASLVLALWVMRAVPDFPGQAAGQRPGAWQVLRTPGVAVVLLVILAWVLGHNILYTYIVPLLAAAGMAADTGLVLLTFGLAAVAGIALVGLWVDRHLRLLVLLSLAGFAVATLMLGQDTPSAWTVQLSVALWGLTFGGAPTLLQTACADAAGDGVDVAQSMLVTVWNSAIALGGVVGGVLLTGSGVSAFGSVVLVMIAVAGALAWAGRRAGFVAGGR
ncbi:putative MFS family arabinose efflux permease [Pseudomonas hunanensis]|uniref:MFS family arabinose efflux permease n=1 Tax=Pseudomonas hunanensis TaxID=1247546 RepID=A0ACC6JZP8_9PSED|nr:MFS transporter [Pseudomonas hunanensis]MDR6711675.1 putative MFS family arabinose efflux permease [Pseudomonas hunanensis]